MTRFEHIEHFSYKLFSENQSKTKVYLCETSMHIGQHPICLMYKIGVLTGFITLGGIIHRIISVIGVYFCMIHLSIAIRDPFHKNTVV